MENNSDDYVTRVSADPAQVPRAAWNALLAPGASPFMRHEYLCALHESGSATPRAGWTPAFVTLWRGDTLHAACPLYLKDHSYGEYVFDWAWANAYEQHALAYYPKALVGVPFTPVPGTRLLARDAAARRALLQAVLRFCAQEKLSSLHLLFLGEEDRVACEAQGLMARHTVQFHWTNTEPGYLDFDAFLAGLSQDKRKKIRQERRKVAEAGVRFRAVPGEEMSPADWDFFYRCYERTYLEHGNAPYLTRAFFGHMARDMARHWVMFVGEREGRRIACSLVAVNAAAPGGVAYGRYWGALERVDCLHFEACYYQPLQWCIERGLRRFEGGAQGEHKLARALLPVRADSAHWLAHPAFADAVARFLEREGEGVERYLDDLERRSPLRAGGPG
ncbi:MAG: GNAT family N-acetyltransferase [Ramlibacter sp.]